MNTNSTDIIEIFNYFILNFIKKNKQERLLKFLSKKQNWWKITNEFHSSYLFDEKVLHEIKPNKQNSNSIYNELRKLGAEVECFSMLDYLDNNKYQYNLSEKLDDTVGFLIETILYCPKSQLGYFEGGHPKDRFILRKFFFSKNT